MRQKYKEPSIQKTQLKQNPYTKPNPYKLKAKLHSTQSQLARQRYFSTGSTNSNQNPESLFYKRNFKQTTPLQQDNYVSLLQQSRSIMGQNYGFGVPEIDYRVKLNNYLAEKFCPTDGYLDALKDKFALFPTDKDSQFQNLMRTSHITNSKSYRRDDKNSTYSNYPKQNPFQRKNLISASTDRSSGGSLYNSIIYTPSNYIPSSSQVNYTSNTINDSYVSNGYHDYAPPRLSPKDSHMQKRFSGLQQSTVYDDGVFNGGQHGGYNRKSFGNDSPKSIRSFGPQKWLQGRKKINSFVDAVIQTSLNHNQLEEKAPKQITINGNKFFLKHVKKMKA